MESLKTLPVPCVLKFAEVVDILCQLNVDNPVDWVGDLNWICARNINTVDVKTKLQISPEEIPKLVPELKKYNPDDESDQWKFICLNIYYLQCLEIAQEPEHLSVQQAKQLKNVIRNIVGVGISSNLLPNLPYYSKLPSEEKASGAVPVFTRYKRLAGTTYGLCMRLKAIHVKPLIIPDYMKWILCALYQILYCPLKKPRNESDENGFTMTQQIYDELVNNRPHFEPFLQVFASSVPRVLYVRETMMLPGNKGAPAWLQSAVSKTLDTIIRGAKGVEAIAWTMLDAAVLDDPDDSTKSWKSLDIIAKIVMNMSNFCFFKGNICEQLYDLLEVRNRAGEPIKAFERLVALCTKLLFQQHAPLCQDTFIARFLRPLICFTNEHNFSNGEHVTQPISQTLRLWHSLLVERNFNIPVLPAHILTPAISVVFRIYAGTSTTSGLENLNGDAKAVLVHVFKEFDTKLKFEVFDNLLFGIPVVACPEFRSDIELVPENNCLSVKLNDYSVAFRPLSRAEALQHLLKENVDTATSLFTYLLNCLSNGHKYFNMGATKRDLLQLETDMVLDEVAERSMAVYKLLAELAEDANVQKHVNANPEGVIQYIATVFLKTVGAKAHQTTDFESEEFQSLFLILMLLQALVKNSPKENLEQYEALVPPMLIILKESTNSELRQLSKVILLKLAGESKEEVANKDGAFEMSELDKALEGICDPLLPVRGHALMTLAKLVEKKDKCALERKQYLLNIFQQNLKNEDSYIYLSAIGGLAAMGDVFPDTVVKVLADEYSDFSRRDSEDGHEVRMKLGEVLVRVTRVLGEMAPKYKTLLLNTFLVGTKDEDHLIRASSLSNLGEVCRVLGYKLGTIVTEVLVCVHAIITTDKAAEARRAAVTVIRQLFVGLEKEMIVFLKDEILPVYRTLKHIYHHDADDVMRLQAQLALEQLNENMKEFIFPNPQLHAEKKVVMLD